MTFSVTILGSNSAVPAFNRNHTSQYISIHNKHLLIDCGEGTQLTLIQRKLKFSKLDHIFISHLHGDHYLGLMGLIFTMHLFGRTKKLNIYGPKGLAEIITIQLKHSNSILNYKINFIELDNTEHKVIVNEKKFTVETIPLDHRIPCCGFLIREKAQEPGLYKDKLPENLSLEQIGLLKKGKDLVDEKGEVFLRNSDVIKPPKPQRSYAYCSDTRYKEDIVPIIKEVDLLYHETTFLDDLQSRAAITFHTTTKQAATIASKANVKKLILGHFSSRYKELDEFAKEAQDVFANSVIGHEGTTFEITYED